MRRLRPTPLFPALLALLLSPAVAVAAPPAGPPAVIVAPVVSMPLADRTEALGTLQANESVTITANVTETVSAIHFDDGQRVQRGAVLVEMTSAEEHALFEEANARVAEAERQFNRVRSLERTGSAAASLLDERRRDLDIARATLVAVETRLADRLIKAPFDGVVGLRNISLGALVEPGDVITTLDDDRVMKLDFTVPSLFLSSLVPGVAIEARAGALNDRVFPGTIRAIDSRVDPVTRAVPVRALIDNADQQLRPGLLMRVELLRNPREGLVVPEAALLHQGREHFVIVVNEADGNKAERRRVEVGLRKPGKVEVTSGLAAGERVITHGQGKARPGQPVTVMAVDDGSRSLKELLGAAR